MEHMNETPTLAPPAAANADGPSGIGGWLILPLLHLTLDMVLFLWQIGQGFMTGYNAGVASVSARSGGAASGSSADAGAASATALTQGEWASVVFVIFAAVGFIYAGYCLLRFFQKKEQVPTLMTGFYLLVIAKMAINLVLLQTYPELAGGPDGMYEAIRGFVQSIVAGAIWIAYFRNSVRVANTFVH